MRALGYSQTTDKVQISPSPYLPDFIAEGVTDIDFRRLHALGIKHLLIDLDQTLRLAYSKELEQEIIDFFEKLHRDKLFETINIVSNNNRNLERYSKPIRAQIFQPYWEKKRMVRKPSRQFYQRVLTSLNCKPSEAVMIGDKVKFDVAGANKMGILTILVRPRGGDYWFDKLLLARLRERRSLAQALHAKSHHRQSTPSYIREALASINIHASRVKAFRGDARGSEPYLAETAKGNLFVKLYTRRHNLADWLFKLGRLIRFKASPDETPFMSPKQALEHQAYVARLAIEAGVRTPTIVGLIDLGDYRFGLVQSYIDAMPVKSLTKKQLTAKLQQAIWKQAELLHSAGIAHRDLRPANILIDDKARPWLIDFDFATVAATPKTLAIDHVQLLVSFAAVVGAEQAVKYASGVLTPADFALIQQQLKPRHLSHAVRHDIKNYKTILQELQRYSAVLAAGTAPVA